MDKKKLKRTGWKILSLLVTYGIPAIAIIIIVGYIILRCYCFINYGDRPVTEVPAWVWWIMYSGGK